MRRVVWPSALACALAFSASCTTFGTEAPAAPADSGAAEGASPDGPSVEGAVVEAASDAGPGDGGRPVCAGEADCERYVFVTSDVYTGEDIGAAIGADGRCNARAALAGTLPQLVGRSFQAWVSDDLANFTASARLTHGTRPYRLVNGVLVANDWNQLTSGSILHPINVTEQGSVVGQELVWTGTNALGEVATKTCTSWSINGADNTGTVGRANVTDSTWTNSGISMCGVGHRLYCFER